MKKTVFWCSVPALLLLVAVTVSAAPVRLARTPDYHAGKITFGYLGDIWVVTEDGSNPVRITDNTAREVNPRFSPDGRWIGFYASPELKKVSITGGPPITLCPTAGFRGASWGPDEANPFGCLPQ